MDFYLQRKRKKGKILLVFGHAVVFDINKSGRDSINAIYSRDDPLPWAIHHHHQDMRLHSGGKNFLYTEILFSLQSWDFGTLNIFFFFLITKSLQGIWFLLSRSKGADLLALLCWSVGGNKIHSKKKKVNQKRIASRKSIDIPFEFEKKTGFFLLLLFLADWNDFSYSTFDYVRRRRRCNYNFIINIPMGRREKGYNNKIKKELRRE